ncbi:MAG: sigma-70 family RNA polymerase sigma factor [Verrucomicrobia bacterium]|nr:sigma-70 family RNA polymerase sigma factor [Verrucomicrobiota bacterium]
MPPFLSPHPQTDADLVARARNGNRDAFGTIVERYQALVCSIAYSGTGNFARSEDLAQETFLAAWRQLGQLREPGSLRAWLCGIARQLVSNARRREGREPTAQAESLEALEAGGSPAVADLPPPPEVAMSREEEAIVWRALERMPELYREPLVLFYREQQSVARVAESLGLGEEAVRQRLSRGRRLLQEQVAGFVECALERSSPGRAFTLAVLAALPGTIPTASATAAAGALLPAASKSSLGLGALLGPLFGAVSGLFTLRATLHATRTERERVRARRDALVVAGAPLAFCGFFALAWWAGDFWEPRPRLFVALGLAGCAVFSAWYGRWLQRIVEGVRQLRAEELARVPDLVAAGDARHRPAEYISARRLWGLPLLHLRTGVPPPGAPAVCGWIALGDRALSPFLAVGAFACAPISIGAVSVGLVSVGVLGLGAWSLSTLAVGGIAVGAVALGWHAFGSLVAFGWTSAVANGLAAAREYAVGGHAWAAHENDAVARAFIAQAVPAGRLQTMVLALAALTLAVSGWNYWRSRPYGCGRR